MNTKEKKCGAFYDLDGTLFNSNIIYAYVYYALALPKIRHRFFRIASLLSLSPSFALTEMLSRSLFNKWFYRNYKGISFDFLELMSQHIAKKVMLPRLYPEAKKLLEKGKEMNLVQVVVSGSLDLIVKPLYKELEIDHYIANQLEYKQGEATGKLIPPILSDEAKAKAIQKFANENDIDLSRSYAFGDSLADLVMLESCGFPCAVNPKPKLLKIAKKRGWPILYFK